MSLPHARRIVFSIDCTLYCLPSSFPASAPCEVYRPYTYYAFASYNYTLSEGRSNPHMRTTLYTRRWKISPAMLFLFRIQNYTHQSLVLQKLLALSKLNFSRWIIFILSNPQTRLLFNRPFLVNVHREKRQKFFVSSLVKVNFLLCVTFTFFCQTKFLPPNKTFCNIFQNKNWHILGKGAFWVLFKRKNPELFPRKKWKISNKKCRLIQNITTKVPTQTRQDQILVQGKWSFFASKLLFCLSFSKSFCGSLTRTQCSNRILSLQSSGAYKITYHLLTIILYTPFSGYL